MLLLTEPSEIDYFNHGSVFFILNCVLRKKYVILFRTTTKKLKLWH
jgi:hypothetical protein